MVAATLGENLRLRYQNRAMKSCRQHDLFVLRVTFESSACACRAINLEWCNRNIPCKNIYHAKNGLNVCLASVVRLWTTRHLWNDTVSSRRLRTTVWRALSRFVENCLVASEGHLRDYASSKVWDILFPKINLSTLLRCIYLLKNKVWLFFP